MSNEEKKWGKENKQEPRPQQIDYFYNQITSPTHINTTGKNIKHLLVPVWSCAVWPVEQIPPSGSRAAGKFPWRQNRWRCDELKPAPWEIFFFLIILWFLNMLENTFQHISLTTEWGMGMVNGFNGIFNDNAYQSITLMVFYQYFLKKKWIKLKTELNLHHIMIFSKLFSKLRLMYCISILFLSAIFTHKQNKVQHV